MSKISKLNAFTTMVEYIDCGETQIANDIFKIINRSQKQDKKNNVISSYISLTKKEEKYFKEKFIIKEEQCNKEQEN